jgi:hypothetical protein
MGNTSVLENPCSAETFESLEKLGSQIVAFSGRLAAATCRWLLLVAQFDERDGARQFGLVSTARWIGHYCGLSHRTAVEHVRVARSLTTWPKLMQEMEAGRLSYSQIRAISRALRPEDSPLVDDLIACAQHGTTSQLESLVRGIRTGDQTERPDYVRTGWTAENRWQLNARLAAEDGSLVAAAIDAVAQEENLTAAEALVRLAEIGIAALNDSGETRHLRGEERASRTVPASLVRSSNAWHAADVFVLSRVAE